jgi:hypothetical protein
MDRLDGACARIRALETDLLNDRDIARVASHFIFYFRIADLLMTSMVP